MRAISLLFSLIILCVFSVAPLAAQSVTRGLEAEVEALVEAHKLVSTVTDKASAKAVSEKLKRTFDGLRPYFGHRTSADFNIISDHQNTINNIMATHVNEPYFVSSGLQEVWTLICDPESRRAVKGMRR